MWSRRPNNHLVSKGFHIDPDTSLVTLLVSKDVGYQVTRGPAGTGEVVFRRPANQDDPFCSEFDGQLDIRFPDGIQQPADDSAVQKLVLVGQQEFRSAVSSDTPDIVIKVAPGVEVQLTIV